MSKTFVSEFKRWPGSVTFYDPLTLPQVVAFQEATYAASRIENATAKQHQQVLLPAILTCVERWEIEGVEADADKFPASPMAETDRFFSWLYGSLISIAVGSEGDPNE